MPGVAPRTSRTLSASVFIKYLITHTRLRRHAAARGVEHLPPAGGHRQLPARRRGRVQLPDVLLPLADGRWPHALHGGARLPSRGSQGHAPASFVTPSRSSAARRASAAASPSRCLAGCSTWASTTSSTRTPSSSRRSSRTCCGRSSSAVTRLRRQRRRRHFQRLPRTARRRRPRASSSLCGERCTSSAR